MESGYVRIWREIENHQVWQDESLLKLFLHLIIRAAHCPRMVSMRTGRGKTFRKVGRGQLIVGREKLAETMGWPPSTTHDRLLRLKKMGCISVQPDTHFSTITVVNYERFQPSKKIVRQPSDTQRDSQTNTAPDSQLIGYVNENFRLYRTAQGASPTPINGIARHPSDTKKELEELSNSTCSVPPKSDEDVLAKPRVEPEDLETAIWIWEQIVLMQPGRKAPNLQQWANDVRLMRVQDNRSHEQIRALFAKANADEFWRVNILSPAKLRQKFDDLALRLCSKDDDDCSTSNGEPLYERIKR